MFEWLAEKGGVMVIYDHAFTAYSLNNWKLLFTAAQKSNVNVMTLSQAVDYIIANGSTADSGVTYTRTFTDQSDYQLKNSSPCKNAGISIVGLTTDFLGKPIRGLPDIGAYELQPTQTGNRWGFRNRGF